MTVDDEVHRMITRVVTERGWPPSVTEIAAELAMTRHHVRTVVRELHRAGRIEFTEVADL